MRIAFVFFLLTLWSIAAIAQQAPNFLWIVCEDISPDLSFYGDSTAHTPNLDKLAAEATIYDRVFSAAPVCAPSRSAIITGVYPSSLGTIHMRTARETAGWGNKLYADTAIDANGKVIRDLSGHPIRQYSAVIPSNVTVFTEYLRRLGYFTTNNQKTDYQFSPPLIAWDQNGKEAHWRNRPEGVPFFAVFNIEETHESRLWVHDHLPLTVNPDSVQVPPYFIDDSITRHDIARHYSNIEIMDSKVGQLIAQLKEDNLYDNTIIFFYSDHGGPLPREKRELFLSGLHVPLITRIPGQLASRSDELISFTDLAPTVLSLAGIQPAPYMQGRAFLGNYATDEPQFIYATSDRFDEFTDRSRAVISKEFTLIINDFPEIPGYKPNDYRLNIPLTRRLEVAFAEGRLNNDQKIWFLPRSKYQLYSHRDDPYNMNDVFTKNEQKAQEMASAWEEFKLKNGDKGLLFESELIKEMWPDNRQPVSVKPGYKKGKKKIKLNASPPGHKVSYLFTDVPIENINPRQGWKPAPPFIGIKGKSGYLYLVSERIGFALSEWVEIKL